MANEVIVGGKRYPCESQVRTWYETHMSFAGLPRLTKADLIVLHWTGSDGMAAQTYDTLLKRRDPKTAQLLNLSVNFHIDHFGTITQYADALDRCAHAGPRGNRRGPGIEISNRADSTAMVRNVARAVVKETINGETSIRTAFTAQQTRSCLALLKTLTEALGIPLTVPMVGADVNPNLLSDAELARFTGIVGHYHLELKKQDAGLAILRAIIAKPLRGRDGAAE